MKTIICLKLIFIFVFISFQNISLAEIYRYKDENGVWRFTDTPPADQKKMDVMEGMLESPTGLIDLKKELYSQFKPISPVEKASIGTVTIKSSIGSGSGFFISEDGHILTNKHVIKISEAQLDKAKDNIKNVDEDIKKIEKKFDSEEAQMKDIKNQLNRYKKFIDEQENTLIRKNHEERYQAEMKRYMAWEKDFRKRKESFESKKKIYNRKKTDFTYKTNIARLSKNFKIILKNNVKLDAYLVSVSSEHDLALLKVDGYRTPYIKPGKLNLIYQGSPVYAIGSPAKLRDSVSFGIVSGFEGNYIKTDAKIYPGNSGGPLITREGYVIGINTLKKLTHKFEGLGFAIPIETAIREFKDILGR